MDGRAFLLWVIKSLCPCLSPGAIVVLDNVAFHKVRGVKEAIEATGASLLYLPPYSPDLNPIELFFAKLKAYLKAHKPDSNPALSSLILSPLSTPLSVETSCAIATIARSFNDITL
jgi:transposase